MSTKHSKLPPSSAARRMACPGSRALEEKYKLEEFNEAAEEGELAHRWAANCLGKRLCADTREINFMSNNEDLLSAVKLYTDDVLKTAGNQSAHLHIEEQVNIPTIHEKCWGTPDCWFFNPDTRELYLWDFKYGHKFIEVFENWQLIEYAAGILNLLKCAESPTIIFRIVQPRSYHKEGAIREWRISSKNLTPYFVKLRNAELRAIKEDAPQTPSNQCDYCSARHVCTALQAAALTASDTSRYSLPLELTAEAVGVELKHLQASIERLKARESGLVAQATAMLKKGARIPNYKLESTMGREQWSQGADDAVSIEAIANALGIDIHKPRELITPKQAVAKGVPEEIVSRYAGRLIGSMKLVMDSDSGVRRVFLNNGT